MKITLTTGSTIDLQEGESLFEALQRNEIYLVASCGGKGTCGKCKVRVLHGEAGAQGSGKLTQKDRDAGYVLSCMSRPSTDLTIEIPDGARLVVGDKIAFSRGDALKKLFDSFDVPIAPALKTVKVTLPPPSLHDNISDLDRLRRALMEQGIEDVRFSHGLLKDLAAIMRQSQWEVELGYVDYACSPEAVYIAPVGSARHYGIAVDIGTTTVVVYLVDLKQGALVDVGSTYNSQMRHGDDVITRIVHATEGGGLEELRLTVVEDINNLLNRILQRHKLSPSNVAAAAISGNTTMSHLFWGLDPGHIREEPYIPTINAFPIWHAGTAGLAIDPQAAVYTMPCVASYVGGDIVSGVLASKLHRNEEVALFMDIGTNGEIAIGNNEWLVTAACSAGPCFEGSGIRHGMRATEGAVEGIRIDATTFEPELKVVGGARPVGICGSGMIDAISELFLTGLIDQRGKFVDGLSTKRVRRGEDGMEYVFHEDEDRVVTLTEVDIENILRAKAAIYAGVTLMLQEVGFSVHDVQRVYIAGGFGNYLNVERAVTLGMLPDLPLEKFTFLGNTSVAGAYISLLSDELRKEAEAIASRMTYIELSVSRGFMDEYMSALFLPHTDASQFPTVMEMVNKRRA